MAEELARPIDLKFRGLDTEAHRIDALQFGKSLQGTARFYNSVFLYWFEGQIPRRIAAPPIQVQVGPPKDGSIWFTIYMMMAHGTLALYPKLLWELVDMAVPHFVKAIFAQKAGRKSDVDKHLEVIAEMSRQNAALAQSVHRGHLADKRQLYEIIRNITAANGQSLSDMASPIGRSAASLTHFDKQKSKAIVIDEPMAEAFRAKEELIVGDQTSYRGKIIGVDKATGSCRFAPEEGTNIRARITDPVLQNPNNIYTHALDGALEVEITAKPVLRDGEIKTLYISDAHQVGTKRRK